MREVTMYVAWDDSEFETADECLRYEQQAIEAMSAVNDCYEFFNVNNERFFAPRSEDIWDWLNWLSDAAEHCRFIRIRHTLPTLSVRFIDREWGYCICPEDFPAETGLFMYDDFKNDWVKVGE